MKHAIRYSFHAKLWRDAISGGWHFISFPIGISEEIRQHLKFQEEGWGRMKAQACIASFEWDTSIWFDSKSSTYLLPVKAEN